MSNYIEFVKIYPHEVMDVIKRNNYLSAQDVRKLASIGYPILSLLIKSSEKTLSLDELYSLIRKKKVTYEDVKNAINQWKEGT